MEQYQNEEEKQVSALMKEGGEEEEAWGTWEELLLACAVKRHGVEDWDSVAMEVQGKKTSLSHLHTITAFNCKQKYHDLQRRFHQDEDEQEEEDSDPIPWLHHLKNLRLAQLRHDLNRYDVSITSLETKVKRLEEERKLHEETKPDLEEHNSKRHGSNSRSEDTLNDKEEKNGQDRFKQENQSANGSNSTCSKTQEDHHHHLHNENNNNKISSLAEPEAARASQSDSDNGSCETVRRRERESGSSEAQSSASLTRQRRRMLELKDQRSEQVEEKSKPLATVLEKIREHEHGYLFERRLTSQERDEYKSMVHQHVDLATIEAKLQNSTDSSESSYSALQFYRDLLVLFTNAVVFFPKSSAESMAANQLRRLVLNEMNKSNFISTRPVHPSSNSLPSQTLLPKLELKRSDSLLAKHKSTTPIFVCRKRSSITSKPSSIARVASTTADHRAAEALGASDVKPPINSKANIAEEDNVSASAAAAKADEKPVTGTVSSRRTAITDHEINAKDSSTKKTFAGPSETPKGGRKRKTPEEEPATPSNKRRSGAAAAADFLKRLKRNSPAKQKVNLKSGTGTSSGAEQKKRGGNNKKPHDKVKERVSKQSGGDTKKPHDKVKERVSKQSGGDTKKQVKEESSPSKRSVGRPSKKAADTSANVVPAKRSRENVAKQQQQRPPRKRSRR